MEKSKYVGKLLFNQSTYLRVPSTWQLIHDEEYRDRHTTLLKSPLKELGCLFVDWKTIHWEGKDSTIQLMEETNDFIEGTAEVVGGFEMIRKARTKTQSCEDWVISRTGIVVNNSAGWIVQFVADLLTRRLYILHVTGPRRLLREPLRVIRSFRWTRKKGESSCLGEDKGTFYLPE